jgi:hypothetical protein
MVRKDFWLALPDYTARQKHLAAAWEALGVHRHESFKSVLFKFKRRHEIVEDYTLFDGAAQTAAGGAAAAAVVQEIDAPGGSIAIAAGQGRGRKRVDNKIRLEDLVIICKVRGRVRATPLVRAQRSKIV